MDVLIFFINDKPPRLHILPDAGKAFDQLVPLLGRQNPLLGQHHHMGDAALDILAVQLPVKPDGRIKGINLTVRVLGKASSP